MCGKEDGLEKDYTSLFVIFLGIFLYGIGSCFYYVFGLPYGDDNSSKEDGPMQFGVIWAARLLGPSIGYALGFAALRVYVDPSAEVDFDEDDPRWIGAWWLGFPVIAALLLCLAPLLFLFPQRLPSRDGGDTDAAKMAEGEGDGGAEEIGSAKEFAKETLRIYRRLLSSPIYVFNMGSLIFSFFGFIGFTQFLPKYLEFHYRQTASKAGGLSGVAKTAAAVIGCLVPSYFIGKYRVHARKLGFFCSLCELLTALAFVSFALMACPPMRVVGVAESEAEGRLELPECARGCGCGEGPGSIGEFHPICSGDGRDFFSPCVAGCANREGLFYSDCACIANSNSSLLPAEGGGRPTVTNPDRFEARDGQCPVDCKGPFVTMLVILAVVAFLSAATKSPNTLIMIRVINPKDKTASVSFILVVRDLSTNAS